MKLVVVITHSQNSHNYSKCLTLKNDIGTYPYMGELTSINVIL